jgi:hypothetical protein
MTELSKSTTPVTEKFERWVNRRYKGRDTSAYKVPDDASEGEMLRLAKRYRIHIIVAGGYIYKHYRGYYSFMDENSFLNNYRRPRLWVVNGRFAARRVPLGSCSGGSASKTESRKTRQLMSCSWPKCEKKGGKCYNKPFSELACMKESKFAGMGVFKKWLVIGLSAKRALLAARS